MATNGQNQRTQLLSDAPADEDAFEGGHDRVAEALAGLIREEDGGKAVALKGPFGSGKSTVVEILEDKIVDEGETRIFTYDAWEHQGDPLRRSFLESLIEFLREPFPVSATDEEKRWAEEDDWEKLERQLAGRTETTITDTKPKLTGRGRLTLILLFLAPLGLILLNNFLTDFWGGWQTTAPGAVLWVLGFVLAISPLLVVGWTWVFAEEDEDLFYLLVKETREEEETKTIKTPDPTTVEFQDFFEQILSDALKDSNRQLIFVVDNLDRLPPRQALSTWATMRTFFDAKGENEVEWMDRFWLVVPLNFDALRGVFTDSAGIEDKKGDSDAQDDSEQQREIEQKDTDFVEAFANKTFSTVLRVAPPVLSDWEQFMKDQLNEAFDLNESEDPNAEVFHTVYRLYRIAGVEDNSIPTPRDIKIFINRLSGLYRQWGDEIGLPMLAAYQLKGDEISQDGQELTDSTFLEPRIQGELRNGDWQKQFAALHFNAELDKATQVLIEEGIQTALETGNEEETLEEYSSIAGFANVVDRVIPRIARGDDPTPIPLAALALDTVSLGAEDIEYAAWRKLRVGIQTAEDWYPNEDRKGEGLLKIIRRAPGHLQDELAQDILSTVSSVDLDVSAQDFPNDATRWADGVLPLVRAFKDREELLRDDFHVPSGWPTYISVISHLEWEDDAQDIASFFVPADEPDGIDTAVAEMVSADSLKSAHLRGVGLAKHIEPISNIDWTETSDAIYNRLNWNNNLSDEELRVHLKTALVVATVHGFEPLRQKLGDDTGRANLSHHIQSYQNSDQEIIALCVLLRVLYSAGRDRGANHGNANQGHNQFTNILQNPNGHDSIVRETANLVQEFGISWYLFNATDRWKKSLDFVQRVVQELVTKSEATILLGHREIAGFPDVVGEALRENVEKFKELILAADQDGQLTENLRSLNQDDWLKKLKDESRLLDMVLILTREKDLQLPSAFQDALLDHAEWILGQQSSPNPLGVGEWNGLLKALSEAKRNSFLRSLQGILLAEAGQSLTPVLSMYGDEISSSGVAANVSITDPTDTVNEHFRPLLKRGNTDELNWLSDVLEGHPKLTENIKDDNIWIAFQEIIEEKYSKAENDDEKNKQLEKIADLSDIELKDSGGEGQEDEENEEA